MDLVLQTHDWDCGPSCGKMVAPGIRPPRASKKNGLSPDRFVSWAEKNDILLHHGWNLPLASGMVCLIMYRGTSHYVVVTKTSDHSIWFNCPLEGKRRLTKKQFEAIHTGWGMLVK